MHNIKTSVNILARILAIDYGEKRTGIAVTDELQIIASGLTTVETKKIFSFLRSLAINFEILFSV